MSMFERLAVGTSFLDKPSDDRESWSKPISSLLDEIHGKSDPFAPAANLFAPAPDEVSKYAVQVSTSTSGVQYKQGNLYGEANESSYLAMMRQGMGSDLDCFGNPQQKLDAHGNTAGSCGGLFASSPVGVSPASLWGNSSTSSSSDTSSFYGSNTTHEAAGSGFWGWGKTESSSASAPADTSWFWGGGTKGFWG